MAAGRGHRKIKAVLDAGVMESQNVGAIIEESPAKIKAATARPVAYSNRALLPVAGQTQQEIDPLAVDLIRARLGDRFDKFVGDRFDP